MIAFAMIISWRSYIVVIAQAPRPVLVALNKSEATLAIIDPVEMKHVGKVPTGDGPHEVVILPDGKTAVVANYGAQTPGSSFSVIDLEARKELRRIDISPLMRPHGIVEIGGKVYFTAETNRAIGRFDPVAGKVDWLMGTGQNLSHMLAATSDQKRFFTANIGSDSVTAFEFQGVPPGPSKISQITVGKQPEAIDVSPDGKEVWVGLNAEAAIDIVDTASLKVAERIKLGERPYRVRSTPDGKTVVATLAGTKEIVLIDAVSRKEKKRIKLESAPLGVAFSKNGATIFVTAVQPDLVLKIDIESGAIKGQIGSGQAPDGVAVFNF